MGILHFGVLGTTLVKRGPAGEFTTQFESDNYGKKNFCMKRTGAQKGCLTEVVVRRGQSVAGVKRCGSRERRGGRGRGEKRSGPWHGVLRALVISNNRRARRFGAAGTFLPVAGSRQLLAVGIRSAISFPGFGHYADDQFRLIVVGAR